MHLTASDKIPLQLPLNKKPPRPKPRNTRKLYDWAMVRRCYPGKTVRYIHEQTGIPIGAIYRAHHRGDIQADIGIDWKHDWTLINELGETRTIPQLSKVTGLSEAHLRGEVKRGKLTNYLPVYTKAFK